jgi:PAS domain S-box-containing protein
MSVPWFGILKGAEYRNTTHPSAVKRQGGVYRLQTETGQRKNADTREYAAGEIISRSPAVAFVWKNAEGWPVVYVSDNVGDLFGWEKDDFLSGRVPYGEVVYPDDLSRVSEEVRRFSAEKTAERIIHEPYRIIARDGTIKWVEDLTTILRNEDGSVEAYEGILIDISERKLLEEQLELIQFSIRHASDGITWFDSSGKIIYANDEECRFLGYDREELLTKSVLDIDLTVTPEVWTENLETLRRKGSITRESSHRSKDGRTIPIESSIKFIRYQGREYVLAFRRDISERKRAEEEQAHLQAKLLNALEIANLGLWEHDLVEDVFILNDHFYRLYHTSVEEIGGYTMSSEEHIRRFTHPDDIAMVREQMMDVISRIDTISEHQLEHRFLYPDGRVGYVAVRFFFSRDAAGKVVRAYGVNQDITESKLAERARLANLKYFESMDRINQAIQGGANDLDRILKDVLDVCLAIFDSDRAFLVYPCDPDAPSWRVPMERTRPEYPSNLPPGETVPMGPDVRRVCEITLSAKGAVSFGPGGDFPASEDFWEKYGFRSQIVIALHPKVGKPWQFGLHQCSDARVWTTEEANLFEKIARRLTDSLTSLLMYRDLRKNEAFLNSIVENIPDTILVKDAEELRFLSVNRAGEKLLGFSKEELIGKNSFDLVPEDLAKLYAESDRLALVGRKMVEVPEETIRNKAGEPRVIQTKKLPVLDEHGNLQHLLIISKDITDFRKLQAQLNQAQKMEALGTMSGGIAHDFNNILQPMLGYCEFLKEDLPPDSPQQKFVEGIFESGLRAKDLVNQILAFSRQSDRQMISVRIAPIVKEVVKLCRSIIPSNIEIRQDVPSTCAPVLADPTQIHQVIMNLMINGYHAMEDTGGRISVSLTETRLNAEALKGTDLKAGRYAMLSVTDTGCGIEAPLLEKVFEPYFTTKAQGKGTGLGLSVVYGIVKEHGGTINVSSEVGKGTTFDVYLPQTVGSGEEEKTGQVEHQQVSGNERILLVDDEAIIVALERQMLGRSGYEVSSCSNGREALTMFKADPDAFDLVITDMNMPNMTGDQLTRELIAIRPDIPIIICTGFSEKIGRDEARAMGVKAFVMKPVTVSEMTRKVRMVLDGEEIQP